MISHELAVVFLALTAAFGWGTGDFAGGLASRRAAPLWVILLSQMIGSALLLTGALVTGEAFPAQSTLLISILIGFSGTFGLFFLFQGLAQHPMSIVAPVSAVVSGILPIFASMFFEGLPSGWQLLGFAFALIAIWLVSGGGAGKLQLGMLLAPILAGVGFSFSFLLVDQIPTGSLFWPFLWARTVSMSLLAIIIWRTRPARPSGDIWHLLVLVGTLDLAGNVFFLLATQTGRLDVAAVLAGLYPAFTVILARIVLHEKLDRPQWVGVGLALTAVLLIAL